MRFAKRIGIALFFSCFFVIVDRLSFIHPIAGLNITPWNPPAALEVIFLFLVGNGWMSWVYITLGVSDWVVRGTLPTSPAALLGNAVLVLCYASVALCLRWALGSKAALRDRREVFLLGLVTVVGSLLTALAYVGVQTWVGILDTENFWEATHRFFVGDLLGLMVLLPLFFVARDKRRYPQYMQMFQSSLFWLLILGLFVCIWFIFSLPIVDQMKYFFSLFFILGLIAATYSLPGATLIAGLIQLPLVFMTTYAGIGPADLMDMQIVMLSLSLTGLIMGAVVDERIRTEEQLRDSLQLVAAGELAGSLAHELHQPMSALNAYAESALMLTEMEATQVANSQPQLVQLLRNIVNETLRATDIVRSLRSYFISGVSTLENVDIQVLLEECLGRMTKRASQAEVGLRAIYEHNQNLVLVDRIQLSTAIGNLLKNAIDASAPGMEVLVIVSDERHVLSIRVVDQGSLLDEAEVEHVFRPFYSNKKDGLGLGLSVSQALVENNGGSLNYKTEPVKCFEILLPLGGVSDA